MRKSAADVGISVRNGPVNGDAMDVDDTPNGTIKRKSRTSISKPVYKDESDSDGEPLVRLLEPRASLASCFLAFSCLPQRLQVLTLANRSASRPSVKSPNTSRSRLTNSRLRTRRPRWRNLPTTTSLLGPSWRRRRLALRKLRPRKLRPSAQSPRLRNQRPKSP